MLSFGIYDILFQFKSPHQLEFFSGAAPPVNSGRPLPAPPSNTDPFRRQVSPNLPAPVAVSTFPPQQNSPPLRTPQDSGSGSSHSTSPGDSVTHPTASTPLTPPPRPSLPPASAQNLQTNQQISPTSSPRVPPPRPSLPPRSPTESDEIPVPSLLVSGVPPPRPTSVPAGLQPIDPSSLPPSPHGRTPPPRPVSFSPGALNPVATDVIRTESEDRRRSMRINRTGFRTYLALILCRRACECRQAALINQR